MKDRKKVELPTVVCFELEPKPMAEARYLEIAERLRSVVHRVDGFVSIERGKAVGDGRGMLSVSYWRDEAAVAAWRAETTHHMAQIVGRREIFADYRLRVAKVVRRNEQEDEMSKYCRDQHSHRLMMALRVTPEQSERLAGLMGEVKRYRSLRSAGREWVLKELSGVEELESVEKIIDGWPQAEIEMWDVERDYGMRERAEAPQSFVAIEEGR